VENFIEFESPWLLLVVDNTTVFIFRDVHIYVLDLD
jgi:hypothetical protein